MFETFLYIFILGSILGISVSIIFLKNLFVITMVSGVFSLLCALFYILMGAADVALTESAVGTGISTVLALITITLNDSTTRTNYIKNIKKLKFYIILVAVLFLIICLIGLYNTPIFGNINNPINNDVYKTYISDSYSKYQIPNIVTMILGSYRGYDTLGETFVIFTAAVGVFSLINTNKAKQEDIKNND